MFPFGVHLGKFVEQHLFFSFQAFDFIGCQVPHLLGFHQFQPVFRPFLRQAGGCPLDVTEQLELFFLALALHMVERSFCDKSGFFILAHLPGTLDNGFPLPVKMFLQFPLLAFLRHGGKRFALQFRLDPSDLGFQGQLLPEQPV